MSDMTKKIGKQGLSGLINKKEKPKVHTPAWKGTHDYHDNYYQTGSTYRGANAFTDNSANLGGPVGGKPNQGDAIYTKVGKHAVLGEREEVRVVNALMMDVRASLKRRGFWWAMTSDVYIREFLEDMVMSGEMRTWGANRESLTIVSEDMADDLLEEDEDETIPLDFDPEDPFSMVHGDDEDEDGTFADEKKR